MGGHAPRNPVNTSPRVHRVSLVATCHLTASLMDNAARFDLGTHCTRTTEAGLEAWRDRLQDDGIFLECQGRGKPSVVRRNKQNCVTGAWLSVFPNWLNDTGLLADGWMDNVRLWYNHSPLDMLTACNGYGAKMTVDHALSCKMGGLVHIPLKTKYRYWQNNLFLQIRYFVLNKHYIGTIW